jgi:hypothetical protein
MKMSPSGAALFWGCYDLSHKPESKVKCKRFHDKMFRDFCVELLPGTKP